MADTDPNKTFVGVPCCTSLDWLRKVPVKTIVDVGANNGDYARHLLGLFPAARLIGFEPLPDAFAELAKKAAEDPRISAHNVALSDAPGRTDFHRSSYGPSSSLLPMAEIHKELAPRTAGEAVIPVEVRRLDDMLDAGALEPCVFLKLDVQGGEDRVLKGAPRLLAAAGMVQIEVSFCTLYHGQGSFDAVHGLLCAAGLELRGFKSQLCSPDDGTPLQAHAYYLRPGLAHPLSPL